MPQEDMRAIAAANSVRSLLIIRFAAGVVGVLLPIALIFVDFLLLGSEYCVAVRDSLSAYYHSGARDIFVVGLGIVGFLLASYKITRRSIANGLSLVAGLAAITVAVFPTSRPSLGATSGCGSGEPAPISTPLQIGLGEDITANVHRVAALVVFTMFFCLCSYTAWHDRRNPMLRDADDTVGPSLWRYPRSFLAMLSNRFLTWRFHAICAGAILLSGFASAVVAQLHWTLPFAFEPLWLAEVGAIWAFSASWFAKGLDDMFWKREPWSRGELSEERIRIANEKFEGGISGDKQSLGSGVA